MLFTSSLKKADMKTTPKTARALIALTVATLCIGAMSPRAGVIAGGMRASSSYSAGSAAFDGTDWMERDAGWTGAADGTEGIFSGWINYTGGNAVAQVFVNCNTGRLSIEKRSSNTIRITLRNTSGTVVIQIDQNTSAFGTITSSTGWVHVLASWKNTSSGGRAQLYLNDTSCATLTTALLNDANIDYTDVDWSVGANVGGTAPASAKIGEVYLNLATSLDLSVESNRRKFRSAGGAPVSLGSDGSTPTGSAPILYLKGVYSSFTTNSGTGGDMVLKGGGALTDGGSIP